MGIPFAAPNIALIFGPLKLFNHLQSRRRLNQKSPSSSSSEIRAFEKYPDQELPMPIEVKNPSSNLDQEVQDFSDLNDNLVTLAAIFPDVRVEVFREMLLIFDGDSRLALVTESLLKHKTRWVKGRHKPANKTSQVRDNRAFLDIPGQVSAQEKFRSPSYKKAVQKLLYKEFRGLSRSTINTVLDGFNHSYTLARPTLNTLSPNSWRSPLSFIRYKIQMTSLQLVNHPLVVWQSNGLGSQVKVPSLRTSGCPELDKELTELLIIPAQQEIIADQEKKDYTVALELNNAEAEKNQCLHDCECCYCPRTFEDLSACEGGHFTCFECIRNSLNEAVFGQGWQSSINLDHGTLRCIAATSDKCTCIVPFSSIERALNKDKSGKNILQKLDERLAEDNLMKSCLPLIRCPFCTYAEVDELYIPESQRSCKLKHLGSIPPKTFAIFILGVGMIPLILFILLLFSLFLLSSRQNLGQYVQESFKASVNRIRRKGLGLKFTCENVLCGRASCRSCYKEWSDIHICHESSLQDLRKRVELAMSDAIKRTCSRCNTSFVKTSGCNKITCICGYQMCYVCRKDIGNGEGYRHFCEHFRPAGGRSCSECTKCDLYRCEDDEVVLREAKLKAQRQWINQKGSLIGCDEILRKVIEAKWKLDGDISFLQIRRWRWKVLSKQQMLDTFLESIIVV